MRKPLLFISHISEEAEIAHALKELVDEAFLSMIEVFVSSNPRSVRPGKKWLNEITEALKACVVEIILASPTSVNRPWVNFEAGSGWIRDIPVIPLCHSGMHPGSLPPPLSALQAASATDEKQLEQIFPILAEALGCDLPHLNYSKFIHRVKEYEGTTRQIIEMSETARLAKTDGLLSHELVTLVEIAESYSLGEKIGIGVIRSALERAGYRGVAVALAIKMLTRKGLVEMSTESDWPHNEDYLAVRLTDEGWDWLEANRDKIMLTFEGPSDDRKADSTSI